MIYPPTLHTITLQNAARLFGMVHTSIINDKGDGLWLKS
jgi:hypothetical protein